MANYYLKRKGERMRIALAALLAAAMLLTGCSNGADVSDEIGMQIVTFPNGKKIHAEAARTEMELIRGLMFRESMPPGRGMLFTHPDENTYHYWMYQTKIPLDIIWMDTGHRIVEMSLNTPPCPSTSAKQCPNFGGNFKSRFVLELNSGVAAANGVRVGDTLEF